MSAPTLTLISSVLIPIAYFLDIRFATSRSKIHDRFIRWWDRLSDLKLRQAIRQSIAITERVFDRICGPKIFSIGALFRSTVLVTGVSALRLFWLLRNATNPYLQRVLGIVELTVPVVLPGVIVLVVVRALLRSAAKKPGSVRLFTLGIMSLLLLQLGVEIMTFFWGILVQFWINIAYTHQIPPEDATIVLGTAFAFFFAFSRLYGYLALSPAILFAILFIAWILIMIASGMFRLIEEFLRLQVEESVKKPFTSIATALCMLLALCSAATLFPYCQTVDYLQIGENNLNRSVFALGERSISGPPGKPPVKFILYNLRLQAALIAIEFIGPTAQEAQNLKPITRKIMTEWSQPNQSVNETPEPAFPKH